MFKDKLLRRAVAALINRPEILQKVYLGQNSPLYSMIPNGMVYHSDDFKTAMGDGNVALADKLLAQAGYSAAKPFEFDLWYTPSHYGDPEVNMAEVLKVQLEKSKLLKVNIKSAEWAAYKEKWKHKEMPAFLLGWYPDYMDPDDYTAAFAGTTGSAGMGIYFSNKEWDDLFTEGAEQRGSQGARKRVQGDPEALDRRGAHSAHLAGRPVRVHQAQREGRQDRTAAAVPVLRAVHSVGGP